GQRGEAPLCPVEAGETIDEARIDEEARQQNRQEPPALDKPGLFETNEESRDHRRRRGEEIVHQNEPHPCGEGRKPYHHPDIAAQCGAEPSISAFGRMRYLAEVWPSGAAPINRRISGTIWLMAMAGSPGVCACDVTRHALETSFTAVKGLR